MTDLDTTYLPAVVTELGDAIHALIGPRAAEKGYRDSIYREMRSALSDLGRSATGSAKSARSMPPIWVDGVDWVREVDDTVAVWSTQHELDTSAEQDPTGTPARLRALAAAGSSVWRPQDVDIVRDHTGQLESWAKRASRLIDGEEQRVLELVAPCPECGKRIVYRRDSGGEMVRGAALQMTTAGCMCLACGVVWPPTHLWFLAEVLAVEPRASLSKRGHG